MAYELVAIGTSYGGLDALREVLGNLPREFKAAVAIVQHVAPGPPRKMAVAQLQLDCALHVSEARDKDPIVGGEVVIAPSDYHLLVDEEGYSLSTEGLVRDVRPSADVLFESAADVYRDRAIGVVLTGYGNDGADGLRRIRAHGGLTIAIDPAEALAPEMPEAAISAGAVERVLPPVAIGQLLAALCGQKETIA
ncbi:MAG: chemotaxis protein CheB [Actinobacteria bacterium]|nr:chemotaxis protein CheB [Actinomycetota bacterium]